MKNLLVGVCALLLVGIAGFLYRASVERHSAPVVGVCTADAKICPDGSAVGRTGPSCAFAACPAGNIENEDAGIAFALPEGYSADASAPADASVIGAYTDVAVASGTPSTITVRRFPVPEGGDAAQVMLAETVLSPSGMPPADTNAFTPKVIGTHTFSSIVIERFEGQVHSAYYFLDQPGEVLRFDINETGVDNWTDPQLAVDSLPAHQAFARMLNTLQIRTR